jgi:hypothetical protein
MALTYDNALADALRKAVEERKLEIGMDLIAGAAMDLAHYRWHVGRAQGLTEALELLDYVQKKLEER